AEIENALIGPSGMPRIDADLDPRAAERDRLWVDPPHLVWLRGKHLLFIAWPHGIDAGPARRAEYVIRVDRDDEGGEHYRRQEDEADQGKRKAPETEGLRRRAIGDGNDRGIQGFTASAEISAGHFRAQHNQR